MIVKNMETSSPFKDSVLEAFEVSSSDASSIQLSWDIEGATIPFLAGFRVHYQKVASTYIQYGPKLAPGETEYEIANLVADTYYKVCLVIYRNDTNQEFRECVDASTTNWQLPVSIGSSIGAILALSLIVLIVLLSRCQLPVKYRRKRAKQSSKYDNMSSNYHDDHYDFSETMTHGYDDDCTSEMDHINDHDDGVMFEQSPTENNRRKIGLCHIDKVNIPNGHGGKSHVHPHTHNTHTHQQQRNSLGRLPYTGHNAHHHGRQFRAYSIQADGQICFFNQPCSPLVQDPRKYSIGKEWNHVDEVSHRNDGNDTCDPSKHANNIQKENSSYSIALKHNNGLKQGLLMCSQPTHGFSFIDESKEKRKQFALKTKQRNSIENPQETPLCEKTNSDNLFTRDVKYEDFSALGAVGGAESNPMRGKFTDPHRQSTIPVEMTTKTRMLALPESVSFDEHVL